jgi:hypothetical protein
MNPAALHLFPYCSGEADLDLESVALVRRAAPDSLPISMAATPSVEMPRGTSRLSMRGLR